MQFTPILLIDCHVVSCLCRLFFLDGLWNNDVAAVV